MCSYILNLKHKDIIDTFEALGLRYDHLLQTDIGNAILSSDSGDLPDIVVPFEVYLFMSDNEYIDRDGYLSEKGKQYCYLSLIMNNETEADAYIQRDILGNSIVNLIYQVFYGRGKISKKQLCNLLNFHNIFPEILCEKDISTFLILLNKYSIVVYDKKNGLFTLNEFLIEYEAFDTYFIEPSTPFSNIYNLRKALRECRGNIYWIDKHFRKEAFEIIIDGISSNGVISVTIISGNGNVTATAKNDYMLLKQELSQRSVQIEWRIIYDTSFRWHDRWIIGDNISYNIPPVLAIMRGQRSEIIETKNKIDVTPFVESSQILQV